MSTATNLNEQRVLLRSISWDTYLTLSDNPNRAGRLMIYDRGLLEIISPSMAHESDKSLLGQIVRMYCLHHGIDITFLLSSGTDETLMARPTIVFFGICAVTSLWLLFDTRPQLVIDDNGIVDRTSGLGKIDWADVVSAQVQTINGQSFICLELIDEQKYLSRTWPAKRAMAKVNRMIGFTPIALHLSDIDQQTERIMDVVGFYCESQQNG